MKRSIWIGYDEREELAYQVCRRSLLRHLGREIAVHHLDVRALRANGYYRRPTIERDGKLIDTLSARPGYDGAISTWHANGRFLVPTFVQQGWALFMDGDMLVRGDVARAFDNLDPNMAAYCVKHDYQPLEISKKNGDVQTRYACKNWSSFVIFNCEHPANAALEALIDHAPGRDLHAFCWLDHRQIGPLDRKWNYLVGSSAPHPDPWVVHFTEGVPNLPGYESCEYADEWRAEAEAVQKKGSGPHSNPPPNDPLTGPLRARS